MKVSELREMIKNWDDDLDILISSDEEGNGFADFADVTVGMGYINDCGDIEIHYLELTPEMEEGGYTDEDVRTNAKPCIIFWP